MSICNNFKILMAQHIPHYNCHCHVVSKYYELQFVESGGIELEFLGRHFELEKNSVWLIQPGIKYEYKALKKYNFWNHRYAVLTGKVFEDYKALDLLPLFPWHGNYTDDFDKIIDGLRKNDDLNLLRARHSFETILFDCYARQINPEDDFPLNAVLRKLEDNQPPETVARFCNMSLSTFFRKFRKKMQCTPHQYYLNHRIKVAKHYLESTNMSLKAIASTLNFADSAHFLRQYHKLCGVTPTSVRRKRKS